MTTLTVKEARSYWDKTKGLLGSITPHPLLLRTRWGIHTFGMRYPIDVVLLDSSNKIVALKPHLQPNRIFLWNPKYQTVVELPSGVIGKNKLSIGKQIKLIRE